MALNVPAGSIKNLTFGPGILYITSPVNYTLGTPNLDIGYCNAASFNVTRTILDVPQGSPKVLVTRYATAETAELTIAGLEWNLNNLNFALGTGIISGNAYSFGGLITLTECALLFRHRTPNQGTVDIYIWRAQGSGQNTFAFGDNLMEFSFVFGALASTSSWTNQALADGTNLFRIVYTQGF